MSVDKKNLEPTDPEAHKKWLENRERQKKFKDKAKQKLKDNPELHKLKLEKDRERRLKDKAKIVQLKQENPEEYQAYLTIKVKKSKEQEERYKEKLAQDPERQELLRKQKQISKEKQLKKLRELKELDTLTEASADNLKHKIIIKSLLEQDVNTLTVKQLAIRRIKAMQFTQPEKYAAHMKSQKEIELRYREKLANDPDRQEKLRLKMIERMEKQKQAMVDPEYRRMLCQKVRDRTIKNREQMKENNIDLGDANLFKEIQDMTVKQLQIRKMKDLQHTDPEKHQLWLAKQKEVERRYKEKLALDPARQIKLEIKRKDREQRRTDQYHQKRKDQVLEDQLRPVSSGIIINSQSQQSECNSQLYLQSMFRPDSSQQDIVQSTTGKIEILNAVLNETHEKTVWLSIGRKPFDYYGMAMCSITKTFYHINISESVQNQIHQIDLLNQQAEDRELIVMEEAIKVEIKKEDEKQLISPETPQSESNEITVQYIQEQEQVASESEPVQTITETRSIQFASFAYNTDSQPIEYDMPVVYDSPKQIPQQEALIIKVKRLGR